MKQLISTSLLTVVAFGQITVNVPSLNVSADGAAALYAWMLNQQTTTTTFLSADITAAATSMTVEDASGINAAANSVLLIGGEVVTVTVKTGRVLTITRAGLGTLAAAHKGRIEKKDADGNVSVVNAGDLITVLKYRTPQLAMRQWLMDKMTELMTQGGWPTAVAEDSIINSAKARRDAAIAGAVQ